MPTRIIYPFLLANHLKLTIELHRVEVDQEREIAVVQFIERIIMATQGLIKPSEVKELYLKNVSEVDFNQCE